MRSEEVHSSTLHQTNEDIYGKTVTVLCWINIYAFSKFVDLQSSNMYSWPRGGGGGGGGLPYETDGDAHRLA